MNSPRSPFGDSFRIADHLPERLAWSRVPNNHQPAGAKLGILSAGPRLMAGHPGRKIRLIAYKPRFFIYIT